MSVGKSDCWCLSVCLSVCLSGKDGQTCHIGKPASESQSFKPSVVTRNLSSVCPPVSQSVSQPDSQTDSQSHSQAIRHLDSQSVSQSDRQSVSQSVSQSVRPSVRSSACQSVSPSAPPLSFSRSVRWSLEGSVNHILVWYKIEIQKV